MFNFENEILQPEQKTVMQKFLVTNGSGKYNKTTSFVSPIFTIFLAGNIID